MGMWAGTGKFGDGDGKPGYTSSIMGQSRQATSGAESNGSFFVRQGEIFSRGFTDGMSGSALRLQTCGKFFEQSPERRGAGFAAGKWGLAGFSLSARACGSWKRTGNPVRSPPGAEAASSGGCRSPTGTETRVNSIGGMAASSAALVAASLRGCWRTCRPLVSRS